MSDLISTVKDEETREEPLEGVFQSKFFPSDNAIKELYESEITLGMAFSPISLTHYLVNDERESKEDEDLRGALEEQGKMYQLFFFAREEQEFKALVVTIQSISGWKEIASELKDFSFGQKTLAYINQRKEYELKNGNRGVAHSLGETAKLLENNLKTHTTNGA